MGIGKNRAKNTEQTDSQFWSRKLKAKNHAQPTIFKADNPPEAKSKFISKDVKNFFSFNRSGQSKNSVTYDLNGIDGEKS